MAGQRRILRKAFAGILAENRPDATPEWECKPPRAQESVTRIGYFPERDYKQTNTRRERDGAVCACDPCPPFQGNSTDEPEIARGPGGGREYWRRRLSNPTSLAAHARRAGFPSRPPPCGPTAATAPHPAAAASFSPLLRRRSNSRVKSFRTFGYDDKLSARCLPSIVRQSYVEESNLSLIDRLVASRRPSSFYRAEREVDVSGKSNRRNA